MKGMNRSTRETLRRVANMLPDGVCVRFDFGGAAVPDLTAEDRDRRLRILGVLAAEMEADMLLGRFIPEYSSSRNGVVIARVLVAAEGGVN